MSAAMCACGHPREAHRYDWNWGNASPPEACSVTVTRRHEHGDDAWPCPCRDFKYRVPPAEDSAEDGA